MFDTEKFIYAIEVRPCLYDVASKEYSNRQLKAQSWSDVCEEMVENWKELTKEEKDFKAKELMKKWKALRDNYVKELKEQKKVETGVPAKKRKTYVFFEQLSFLAPHVHRVERTTSNIEPRQTEAENTELEPTEVNDSGSITNTVQVPAILERKKKQENTKQTRTAIAKSIASTTKDLTKLLAQSVEQQREDRSADKYGNRSFLLSFLPIMDSLPMNAQMQARFKILQAFNDCSNMCGLPSTSPSPSTSSATSYTDCPSISYANSNQNNEESELGGVFDISTYLKL